MKEQRIFEINNNAKACLFKEYCWYMQIDTVIELHDTYQRFYCLMTDEELSEAKSFCDMWCKLERTERKEKPCVVYIIYRRNTDSLCIILLTIWEKYHIILI